MQTIRPTTADDLDRVVAIEGATDTTEWLCETGRSWHERALADPDQEHLVAEGFVPYETRTDAIAEPDGTTSDLLVMRREIPG